MTIRSAALSAATILLTLLCAAPAGAATLAEINQLRAERHLGAVTLQPAGTPLAQTAERIAAADDFEFDGPTADCQCWADAGDEDGYYPAQSYTQLGGPGPLTADGWAIPAGPLTTALAKQPYGMALLMDPRLQQIALASDRPGVAQVITGLLDTKAAWKAITILGPASATKQTQPFILLPPAARGSATLDIRTSGRRWQRVGSIRDRGEPDYEHPWAKSRSGAHLTRLVDNFGAALTLAWGSSYRVRAGGATGTFTTEAMPAKLRRASFTFAPSMTRAARRSFLAAVRSASPSARKLLSVIDGMVYVSTMRSGSVSLAGAAKIHGKVMFTVRMVSAHLRLPARQRNELVLHELGHIINFSGVTEHGIGAFERAWKRSARWRCFRRSPVGCMDSVQEIFADQFGFAATGKPPTGRTGYGDPRLLSFSATRKLLRTWFHPTPPGFPGTFMPR